MSTLTATRGLPASGKTSYAMRRLAEATPGSVVRLNRDDIRFMAHGAAHHENRTEVQVNAIQRAPVIGLLRSGADVIADDTNHPEVAPPVTLRPYEPPPGAPPAVLCDIDGTVGSAGGGDAVGAVLGAARAAGDRVLLASGRPEARRGELEEALAAVGSGYDVLRLRQAGDRRPDGAVKLGMFDEHFREGYRIRYVLAGHGAGAEVWRSLRLTVFQVAGSQT